MPRHEAVATAIQTFVVPFVGPCLGQQMVCRAVLAFIRVYDDKRLTEYPIQTVQATLTVGSQQKL